MERMDRRGWVCVGGCGTSGLPPKTVRRIAERVRKRAVVNALRQALTRSAGAARQRHTAKGAQPAGSLGRRFVHSEHAQLWHATRGT